MVKMGNGKGNVDVVETWIICLTLSAYVLYKNLHHFIKLVKIDNVFTIAQDYCIAQFVIFFSHWMYFITKRTWFVIKIEVLIIFSDSFFL